MLKIAIIGSGGIANRHIDGYLKYPDRCRIVALADRFPERAEELKQKFNLAPDCRIAENPLDFVNDDIDLVSICTPPSTHCPLTIAFLKAGKNVLLEKPMAASLEECDAMLAAARESGKMLSVVAQNRFRTTHMRMKSILDSGILGQVKHIMVNSFWWRAHSYYDLDWRGTWASEGGGCTLNHSVHHIDLMLWFLGMPYEVLSVIDNLAHDNSEVEDISMSFFRFKPHALGQLTSSLVHYGEEQAIVIQAEKGSIAMPWRVKAYVPRENGFPEGDNEAFIKEVNDMYESLPEIKDEGHPAQIGDVLTALENGTQPLITGQDGKNAINVIQGIYKSAISKSTVALPLEKGDDFYTKDGLLSRAIKFHEKSKSVSGFAGSSGIVVGGMNDSAR